MNPEQVRTLLLQANALQDDVHVRYAIGGHGREDVDPSALYADTVRTARLGRALADRCRELRPEAVVTTGTAAVLGHWVAHQLNSLTPYRVVAIPADLHGWTDDAFTAWQSEQLRRQSVLIVHDFVVDGRVLSRLIELVRQAGGDPIAALAIASIETLNGREIAGVALDALLTLPSERWAADRCPRCDAGEPVRRSYGTPQTHTKLLDD